MSEVEIDWLKFFSGWEVCQMLSAKELAQLRDTAVFRYFARHETIYREGDFPKYLMCIVSGNVKVCKDGVGGKSQIMRMVKAGEMCGYRAFFAQECYVTTAVASEPSIVCMVPSEVIQGFIGCNNALAQYFIRLLAVDLGESDVHTFCLTQKYIRGRLAYALVFLQQKYGYEEDGKTLNVSLSREDLANLSNMTTSNAIRTLSQFSSEHIVQIKGRKVVIEDAARLQEVAHRG